MLLSGSSHLEIVIGLGSNLGDRRAWLEQGAARVAALGVLRACSFIYETAPVGPPQPDFYNAAVRLETALSPQALLREVLAIELELGRERRVRWGPRTLDLDLLWSPALQVSEPGLTLPHPELAKRAFALAPLLDVAPEAVEPASERRYADILAALEAASVRRLERLRVAS